MITPQERVGGFSKKFEGLIMNKRKPIAPCKECQERTLGCHSSCGAYSVFRANLDNRNKAIRESKLRGKADIYAT